MQRLINKINDSTRETGRLLSVGTRAFSTGPNMEDFASESWFWQASQPRRTLTWMDTWALRCAVDAAAAEALFGRRTFHGAASIQAALTQAASTQAASTQAASTQAASAEDDFTDSDPDENDFDEDDLM
jgi:hypothetical protein